MYRSAWRRRDQRKRRPGMLSGDTAPAAVGGAALLADETDGFAVDFQYATDANRVAKKVAGVLTEYALDAFFSNTGTSPKRVFDASGNLGWSPHNMYIQSETPATRSVTTVVGQDYTVTVTGSGSLTGSAGASGVATQASPLTYTATTTTSTFTLAGSLTRVQMNRGAVATAYLATTATARNGLAIDYDPATLAILGLRSEPAATNLLLNNAALSTQSVTVTAVAHTLSFWGTGTVTLSGVSTAGPLVGTGAANRVSLTFTPTAGSLTLTVTGTVSRAQLEIGNVATSPIPTFGVTQLRTADVYFALTSAFPLSATASTMIADCTCTGIDTAGVSCPATLSDGDTTDLLQFRLTSTTVDGTARSGNVAVAASALAATPGVASHKLAFAAQLDDFQFVRNGVLATADTAGAMPIGINRLDVGNSANSTTQSLKGILRKFTYVPRRMSNAELQAKTT